MHGGRSKKVGGRIGEGGEGNTTAVPIKHSAINSTRVDVHEEAHEPAGPCHQHATSEWSRPGSH